MTAGGIIKKNRLRNKLLMYVVYVEKLDRLSHKENNNFRCPLTSSAGVKNIKVCSWDISGILTLTDDDSAGTKKADLFF